MGLKGASASNSVHTGALTLAINYLSLGDSLTKVLLYLCQLTRVDLKVRLDLLILLIGVPSLELLVFKYLLRLR